MKKLLLSLSLFLGFCFSVAAQKEGAVHKISVGPEFVYPIGLLADTYKIGYGASVQGEYNILPRLNLTASVGYTSLAYTKEIKDTEATVGMPTSNIVYTPGSLGAKYYLGKFYAAATIGGAISPDNDRGSVLAYAGALGTSLSVSAKSSIDIGFRYEEWNLNGRYPFIGLRVAYAFGF